VEFLEKSQLVMISDYALYVRLLQEDLRTQMINLISEIKQQFVSRTILEHLAEPSFRYRLDSHITLQSHFIFRISINISHIFEV